MRRAALAVALGLFVAGPLAAQPAIPDPKRIDNGSRPVGQAAPAGGTGTNQAQMVDSIFETLPPNFDQRTVMSAPNLHFVLFRTGKANTMLVWGGVGAGDFVRFQAAAAAAKPLGEVHFYSPGGSLGDGIKIGYLIRDLKLATRVNNGTICASACNFMFLGGVVRSVEPGARFGVHMFSDDSSDQLVNDLSHMPRSVDEFNHRFPKTPLKRFEVEDWVEQERQKNPQANIGERDFFKQDGVYRAVVDERVRDIQQDSAKVASLVALYLVEMRLSLRFLVEFSDQTSKGIRWLTQEQMRSFNVTTN